LKGRSWREREEKRVFFCITNTALAHPPQTSFFLLCEAFVRKGLLGKLLLLLHITQGVINCQF